MQMPHREKLEGLLELSGYVSTRLKSQEKPLSDNLIEITGSGLSGCRILPLVGN